MLILSDIITISKTTILLLKFFITIIFFIPSMFVYLAVGFIIPVIITFIAMYIPALKQNNFSAKLYAVITHIFLIVTYFVINSNPGTDDTFANLDKVVDSAVYGSIFTMCALITFIIYCVSLSRGYKLITKPANIQKNCPNCGAVNSSNSKFCLKCGTKI